MTATIKPPDKGPGTRRPARFSSMEILGFFDSKSTWSDSAATSAGPATTHRGRHETTVADLHPHDVDSELTGSNVRWWLVLLALLAAAGLAGLAFWLYQRPQAEEQASISALAAHATELEQAIPALEEFNEGLLTTEPRLGGDSPLSTVESAARSLFDASAELSGAQTELRAASSQAASSALDGVRLAMEAHSYRAAVLPVLTAPELETDPELIALDEAARAFGDWQLGFDRTRTALPESVLSDVSEQLSILSEDLSSILGQYMDALREDDGEAAGAVIADLGSRLGEVESRMERTLEDIQTRVDIRLGEVRQGLDRILEG